MTDIALPPDLDRFVRSQVEAGRFPAPTDVIAAGLRLLEESFATHAEHRDDLLASIAAAFDDPRPAIGLAVAFDRLEQRHARRLSSDGDL